MDPYLEASWGDVNHALCTYSRDALQAQLGPGLVARMDENAIVEVDGEPVRRIIPDVLAVELLGDVADMGGGLQTAVAVETETHPTLIGSDDEPLTEAFIQIIDHRSGGRVITVIEFLSPANKVAGPNREKYLRKQQELIDGQVSLVEINLIRRGDWVVTVPRHQVPAAQQAPYYAAVRRGYRRIDWEYYAMPLRQPLPSVGVPLRDGEKDVVLSLQSLVEQAYERGAFRKTTDYTKPCDPPLSTDDENWAAHLARA